MFYIAGRLVGFYCMHDLSFNVKRTKDNVIIYRILLAFVSSVYYEFVKIFTKINSRFKDWEISDFKRENLRSIEN